MEGRNTGKKGNLSGNSGAVSDSLISRSRLSNHEPFSGFRGSVIPRSEPPLLPVYRATASALSGQAEHAELSEGGGAQHAAQRLHARQHQHQPHFRGDVTAQLAGHRDHEERRVSVPRPARDDAGHQEREARLQGEPRRRRAGVGSPLDQSVFFGVVYIALECRSYKSNFFWGTWPDGKQH